MPKALATKDTAPRAGRSTDVRSTPEDRPTRMEDTPVLQLLQDAAKLRTVLTDALAQVDRYVEDVEDVAIINEHAPVRHVMWAGGFPLRSSQLYRRLKARGIDTTILRNQVHAPLTWQHVPTELRGEHSPQAMTKLFQELTAVVGRVNKAMEQFPPVPK